MKATGETLVVHVDGATGTGRGPAGIGLVVRDTDGCLRRAEQRWIPRMSNNEAEYHAVIWALEALSGDPARELVVCSDSEIVVNQMLGRFSVNSPRLKPLHRRACALLRRYRRVRFTHVPRETNRVADALARDACARAAGAHR